MYFADDRECNIESRSGLSEAVLDSLAQLVGLRELRVRVDHGFVCIGNFSATYERKMLVEKRAVLYGFDVWIRCVVRKELFCYASQGLCSNHSADTLYPLDDVVERGARNRHSTGYWHERDVNGGVSELSVEGLFPDGVRSNVDPAEECGGKHHAEYQRCVKLP